MESTSSIPSSSSTRATAPISESVFFSRKREQQLREAPVRPNRAENLVVLYLPGHHGVLHALLVQQIDPASQLPKADPVKSFRRLLQRRRGFFANRDHRHLDAAAARSLQHEKRKIAVARDQPPGLRRIVNGGGHSASYFVKPRSPEDSMKRIRSWTSSESARVPRIFSMACDVLSFERSRKRYA